MTAPPDTYYEMLEERLPGHGEDVDELKSRGLLLDGSTDGGQPRLLLQIFAETLIGPGLLRVHPAQGRRQGLW
jgi:4-hydroxyphenylpyruvate dioxygenase